MKRLVLLACAVALAAATAAGAAAPPAFRLRGVDVDGYPTIRLVVRSADPAARPPIFENRLPVDGATYTNLGASKAVVIAIDRSQSMAGEPLREASAAAKQLVERKGPSDRIEVVTFGSTALAATGFTGSKTLADSALSALAPDPTIGTSLYDATVLSASRLGAQPLASRVLVLLTDGHDLGSSASLQRAIAVARRANTVVYTIALGHATFAPLQELARGTGGEFYRSPTASALASAYRQIGSELNHTWKVSYTSNAAPGDRVTISVGTSRGPSSSLLLPIGAAPSGSFIPKSFLQSPLSVLVIVLLVAGLVYLAVERLRTVPESERLRQRVWEHTETAGIVRTAAKKKRLNRDELMAALNRRIRGVPQLERLERLVQVAAVPVSTGVVVLACLGCALMLALFVALVTGSAPMIVLFLLVGLTLPLFGLRILARRRIAAVEEQLPEVLATMASSLRVGHGLKQSLQTVASEGSPPLSVELRRVLAEARLGLPLEEALVAMCVRLGSDDLAYVATAVDVQSQVGGSLAGIFDTVADTVRERQQHRRRVRAVTSTARATATVMSLMPFGFLTLLLIVSPHYITPFLGSHIGRILMLASIVSIAIAAVILNRIASVKSWR